MSFLGFPPEINSGLMYAGPGSGSLIAAAAAWDALASDLSSTAVSYSSVVSGLTGGPWTGPSSASLATASAPYLAWLQNTADQAAQIGAQAKAQVSLYESAHAATIPPAVIEANRALLATLVATNFFAQNTPAIMATEAMYGEFWAQDGATMDTYLASSQNNTATLTEPSPAPQVAKATEANLAATKSVVDNGVTDVTQALSDQLSGLNLSGIPTEIGQWLGNLVATGSIPVPGLGIPGDAIPLSSVSSVASMGSVPARFAMYPMSMLMQLARMGQSGATGLAGMGAPDTLMTAIGQFVDGKLQGAVGTLAGHFTSATQAISAKLGQAASMGALKVPQGWSAAAGGTMVRAAPVLPNTAIGAPAMSSSGFPGGPFGQALMGALSGRGLSGAAAKVPKIIPRPSAGG